MRYDIKIEFEDKDTLEKLIKRTYFSEIPGKINGNSNHIIIENNTDENLYTSFKGLNNTTIKVCNTDLIDGSLRCIVEEVGDLVKLYPISTYCHDENNRWVFY